MRTGSKPKPREASAQVQAHPHRHPHPHPQVRVGEPPRQDPGSSLWAVTTYYNPGRYRRRRANFDVFRANLPMPLLAIEWSASAEFELLPGDAELLVQVTGGDVLWQKERLLNLALEHLPPNCRQVAWVDCDIVFETAGIERLLLSMLGDCPIVQPYASAGHVAPVPIERMGADDAWRSAPVWRELIGLVRSYREHGRWWDEDGALEAFIQRIGQRPTPGFAWAANRDFLTRHPPFDVWVVGGGDTAYAYAALDAPENVVQRQRLSAAHRELYLERAAALRDELGDRIGFLDGRVLHLWHGDIDNRGYYARHDILAAHEFDPARDLRLDTTGVWAWGEAADSLREGVVRYFEQRREDDEPIDA